MSSNRKDIFIIYVLLSLSLFLLILKLFNEKVFLRHKKMFQRELNCYNYFETKTNTCYWIIRSLDCCVITSG